MERALSDLNNWAVYVNGVVLYPGITVTRRFARRGRLACLLLLKI